MKRILFLLLLASALTYAASSYADAVPLRVGPVSVYGALGTSGNKVISQSSGKQVMLRGMSWFWSDATGVPYYNSEVLSWAVSNLGIDVIRFAMAIGYYDSNGGTSNAVDASYSYLGNSEGDISLLDKMVQAAIENDIYIIVDWHSHRAISEQTQAAAFFSSMAQRYAGIPNIIWEVFNEPVNTSWANIKSYGDAVIGGIRNYSSNLALIGTSSYSQNPNEAISSPISATNVAYVLHFYAATHSVSTYGARATQALNAGLPVFISEWGTTSADGSGSVSSSETANWITYMESNKISNCNWSLRHATSDLTGTEKTEASAMFDGNTVLKTQEALSNASFTTSGTLVKNYLTAYSRGNTWADSLVVGKQDGSCSFNHVQVSLAEGSVSGLANSACSYTSSRENVAIVENGVIQLKGAGYTVLTANDGSQSVVTVTALPSQTLNFPSYTCRIDSTCTGMSAGNYSGEDSFEKIINRNVTEQGGTLTYTSDNPEVVSIHQVTCNGSSCSNTLKGTSVWVARFHSLGTAAIHAIAPAVTGYAALDTVVNFYLLKKAQKYNSLYLRDTVVALNSSTLMLIDTARYEQAKITYSFSPEGYASQNGEYLVAGDQDMTITLTANIAETENYEGLTKTVTVVIGLGGTSIQRLASDKSSALKLQTTSQDVSLSVEKPGFVEVKILNSMGQVMKESFSGWVSGEQALNLSHMQSGFYLIRVRQGKTIQNFGWSHK